MKVSFVQLAQLCAFALLVIVSGCSTAKRAPMTDAAPAAGTQGQKALIKSDPPLATAAPSLPAGEYTLRVDSEPIGALVVVNGIPIGKTPQRVILPGTPRGFCREQVSLKVRFIAADAGQMSQTVEELLTPLDKIPAAVNFTPSGTSRVPR
jgi:hypothetical protein